MKESDMSFFQPYEKMAIVGLGEGRRIWVLRVQEKQKESISLEQSKESKKKNHEISQGTFFLIARISCRCLQEFCVSSPDVSTS
jgi:hypothetical protein